LCDTTCVCGGDNGGLYHLDAFQFLHNCVFAVSSYLLSCFLPSVPQCGAEPLLGFRAEYFLLVPVAAPSRDSVVGVDPKSGHVGVSRDCRLRADQFLFHSLCPCPAWRVQTCSRVC